MTITKSGLCRLASGDFGGETIDISFDANYNPPSPGSTGWSITATTVRVNLTMVKQQGPIYFLLRFRSTIAQPFAYAQQYVRIQRITDAGYEGELDFPVYIRGGDNGQTQAYKQFLQIDRMFDFLTNTTDPDTLSRYTLIDPINHTSTFQIDMYAATPFATTDQALWGSL